MTQPGEIAAEPDMPITIRSLAAQTLSPGGQAVLKESPGADRVLSAQAVERALAEVRELAQLSSDWDSYGGEAPTAQAMMAASELLRSVHATFGRYMGARTEPRFIAPRADGGVQVEWGERPVKVSVQVTATGALGYLFVDWRSGARTSDEQRDLPYDAVLQMIARVLFAI